MNTRHDDRYATPDSDWLMSLLEDEGSIKMKAREERERSEKLSRRLRIPANFYRGYARKTDAASTNGIGDYPDGYFMTKDSEEAKNFATLYEVTNMDRLE
jgi:hypothetical protein